MSYIVGFLPWIAFAVVPDERWLLASLLGGGIGLLLLLRGFLAKRRLETMIIEASATVFFVLVSAIALIDPHAAIHAYIPPISDGWLTLTAAGSLLIKRPFTMGIAKTQTPEHVWKTRRFYMVNVVITSVWTVAFALTGVALVLLPASGATTIAAKVAGFVLPGLFTVAYVARVRRAIPAVQEGQSA